MRKRWFLLVFLALAGILAVSPAGAQQSETVISVALPEFTRNFFDEALFDAFEAANPGVRVHLVFTDPNEAFTTPAATDFQAHLDDVAEIVSRADVIAIDSSSISPVATRAGYLLDLSPLTSTDSDLNVDDFIPATWQAFQWDGGVWALPVSTDVITLLYDPAAFDEAGLAYPNSNWTLTDLENAARTLSERNADNEVTRPGLVTFGYTSLLLRSLLEQSLIDTSTLPQSPALNNPDLAALLDRWLELETEGIVAESYNGDISEPPMRIFSSFGLRSFGQSSDQVPPAGSLLPGSTAGLDVQGFAISSGTQYPELAYALAKFMTQSVEVARNPFSVAPARMSLANAESNGGPIQMIPLSPEGQALIDQGLVSGLSPSEMRFGDYLSAALSEMRTSGIDATLALQNAEASAFTNLQAASDLSSTTSVAVATPPPQTVLQPGEISLNFGLISFVQPMPNRDRWENLMREFAASDPVVGEVTMNAPQPGAGMSVDALAEAHDCFYVPFNGVGSADTTKLLNLDPFIDADPSFDSSDVIGLPQVEIDGRTWALPIVVMPQAMRYHEELFASAGVPAPTNGWTTDTFVDALRRLKTDDQAPMNPQGIGGNYLLSLIAAFGGLPIDYRTTPPTINVTDPNTLAAIRQVLDLAKDGYINYSELARTNFMLQMNGEQQDAITTYDLNGIRFIEDVGGAERDPYRLTTYPTGNQYNAISYNLGTAFISATSQNPEACYRWISTIAAHPELFDAMPARRSQFSVAAQDAETAAFFAQFEQLMQAPNTIVLPSPIGFSASSIANFLTTFWLNRAFDDYVLRDGDLETELAEVQLFATAYQECVNAIPPFDPATQDQQTYNQQFFTCASNVDPTISNLFPAQPAQ